MMTTMRLVYMHTFYTDHGLPTCARTVDGDILSRNAVSSSDLVRRRPTIPVLLTAILYPSPI